jgi:hypothetical protein
LGEDSNPKLDSRFQIYVRLKSKFILIYFSKLEVEVVHEDEEPPNIGFETSQTKMSLFAFNIIESP